MYSTVVILYKVSPLICPLQTLDWESACHHFPRIRQRKCEMLLETWITVSRDTHKISQIAETAHRLICPYFKEEELGPKKWWDCAGVGKSRFPVVDMEKDKQVMNITVDLLTVSRTDKCEPTFANPVYLTIIKEKVSGWCSSVHWAWAVNQRVSGLIPSQGTCLGCRPVSQYRVCVCERQPHVGISLPLFLFLLLFSSLWKWINKIFLKI